MAESWEDMQDKPESFNWQICSDPHCAVWNSDHMRQQFTFFTVATDSTSWPCESHRNIFNQKKNEKRERERKEEGETSYLLTEDIFSTLIFFYAHLIMLLTALEVKEYGLLHRGFKPGWKPMAGSFWQSNNDKHVAGQCPSFTNISDLLQPLHSD